MFEELASLAPAFIALIVAIALWDAVWKAIAMWFSARRGQLVWYICILIFNTAGILPIVYLLFFKKERKRRRK